MKRNLAFLLTLSLLFICSTVNAAPAISVISTYSSSTWLPSDVNTTTCKLVDDYLANRYFAVIFDGTKAGDRSELAKKIGQTEGDYAIIVNLTSFYDPPNTTAHLASDVKPSDTVATILLDYSIYLASSDKWITDRIVQRSVFQDTTVPLEKACQEAVKQSLPKLADKLDCVIK